MPAKIFSSLSRFPTEQLFPNLWKRDISLLFALLFLKRRELKAASSELLNLF